MHASEAADVTHRVGETAGRLLAGRERAVARFALADDVESSSAPAVVRSSVRAVCATAVPRTYPVASPRRARGTCRAGTGSARLDGATVEVTARASSADPCTRATPAVPGDRVIVTTSRTTPKPARTRTSEQNDRDRLSDSDPRRKGRIGWVVVGSLAAGLLAAVVLVAAPSIPAEEDAVTGAVLCGFAVGWALLAVLSVRLTAQPQRWAAAPAVVMGVSGLLLLAFGSSVREVLNWLWPPVVLAMAIWMVVRARPRLRSRSRRLVLYPLIAILGLASLGGGYQTVASAADARAYPMPGQLVDVGGHRLHLNCTGSGTPTVVLQPGLGEMSSNMGWIAPAVARDTRVCVYDRAGRGWSDPADTPQDAATIATDLHTLLQRADIDGPYVLAGHSFGGRYVLTYAARYPDDVAGMVLIDTTPPASEPAPAVASSGRPGSYDVLGRVSALASAAGRLGVARLYSPSEGGTHPPQSRDEIRASVSTAANLGSWVDEFAQGGASAQQAAAFTDFADKPLIVLTADTAGDPADAAVHAQLAGYSTNGVHRVVHGTHASLIADEYDSAAVSQAVIDVVSSLGSGAQLAE
jgi:pimeloyl-ACP methyl ester carboxylesterase